MLQLNCHPEYFEIYFSWWTIRYTLRWFILDQKCKILSQFQVCYLHATHMASLKLASNTVQCIIMQYNTRQYKNKNKTKQNKTKNKTKQRVQINKHWYYKTKRNKQTHKKSKQNKNNWSTNAKWNETINYWKCIIIPHWCHNSLLRISLYNCNPLFVLKFDQEIIYKHLQLGRGHSCCDFFFTKKVKEEVDSIWCKLQISQDSRKPIPAIDFRMEYIMPKDVPSK